MPLARARKAALRIMVFHPPNQCCLKPKPLANCCETGCQGLMEFHMFLALGRLFCVIPRSNKISTHENMHKYVEATIGTEVPAHVMCSSSNNGGLMELLVAARSRRQSKVSSNGRTRPSQPGMERHRPRMPSHGHVFPYEACEKRIFGSLCQNFDCSFKSNPKGMILLVLGGNN